MIDRNLIGIFESDERKPARRGLKGWFWLAVLILLLLFAAMAGRILVVDAPERSDVILMLAGETERRPALALHLLEQGYGRQMIMDVPAGATNFGFTEMELAQKYAQQSSHASAIRLCPIVGLSTFDEAREAQKCFRPEDGTRVLIVTSDYHSRRALSIFRREIQGKTFSVAAARDEGEFGTRWWKHREWAKTSVFEWMRMLWWTAVDRWR